MVTVSVFGQTSSITFWSCQVLATDVSIPISGSEVSPGVNTSSELALQICQAWPSLEPLLGLDQG
jgi:hypothetical protein